jgi:hypothetical protein
MSNKAYEIKHLRGVLLASLKDYFPNGLAAKTLFATVVAPFFPGMKWEEVARQIAYLHERGFVEAIGQSGIGGEKSLERENYRVTPAGLDVASGVSDDPAIEVEV